MIHKDISEKTYRNFLVSFPKISFILLFWTNFWKTKIVLLKFHNFSRFFKAFCKSSLISLNDCPKISCNIFATNCFFEKKNGKFHEILFISLFLIMIFQIIDARKMFYFFLHMISEKNNSKFINSWNFSSKFLKKFYRFFTESFKKFSRPVFPLFYLIFQKKSSSISWLSLQKKILYSTQNLFISP